MSGGTVSPPAGKPPQGGQPATPISKSPRRRGGPGVAPISGPGESGGGTSLLSPRNKAEDVPLPPLPHLPPPLHSRQCFLPRASWRGQRMAPSPPHPPSHPPPSWTEHYPLPLPPLCRHRHLSRGRPRTYHSSSPVPSPSHPHPTPPPPLPPKGDPGRSQEASRAHWGQAWESWSGSGACPPALLIGPIEGQTPRLHALPVERQSPDPDRLLWHPAGPQTPSRLGRQPRAPRPAARRPPPVPRGSGGAEDLKLKNISNYSK